MGYEDAHQAELEATQRELERLTRERPDLTGDDLINTAIEAAGYDVGMSMIDICNWCGELYVRGYGDEYIDPDDCTDLIEDCRTTRAVLRTLEYTHYCTFDCCRSAVFAAESDPAPADKGLTAAERAHGIDGL